MLYQYGGLDFIWDAHKAASNTGNTGCDSSRRVEREDEAIRIISVRHATPMERSTYEEYA